MASDFLNVADFITWLEDNTNDEFYALTDNSIKEIHRDDVSSIQPVYVFETGAVDSYTIVVSRTNFPLMSLYKDKDTAWSDKTW